MSTAAQKRGYRLRRKQEAEQLSQDRSPSVPDFGPIIEAIQRLANEVAVLRSEIAVLTAVLKEKGPYKPKKEIKDSDFSGSNEPTKSAPNGANDLAKELFDSVVSYLAGFGISEDRARSQTGKWRQQMGDDGKLLGIVIAAKKAHIIEPVAYITAAVQSARKSPGQYELPRNSKAAKSNEPRPCDIIEAGREGPPPFSEYDDWCESLATRREAELASRNPQ